MIYLIKYNIVIYDTANSSNEFENREETFEEAMQTQLNYANNPISLEYLKCIRKLEKLDR